MARYTIEIEVDESTRVFDGCEGCIEAVFNSTPNTQETKPIKVLKARPYSYDNPDLRDELAMYRKYIHTNECSDEGGWFAFFQPDGGYTDEAFEIRVNGCESEEEAVRELIKKAAEEMKCIRIMNEAYQL